MPPLYLKKRVRSVTKGVEGDPILLQVSPGEDDELWVAAVFAAAVSGIVHGQSAPAGSDWSRVEALGQDTKIRVSASSGRAICSVERVDRDSLRCVEIKTVFFVPVRKEREFPRVEVHTVKLSRQGVSTLAGGAIGLGAGVGIGAAIDASAKTNEDQNLGKILFGLFGGLLGVGIGMHTDFAAGPTIYRAP